MGTARLAIFLVGLVVVALAVWVFMTQTSLGRSVQPGVGLTLILLIVGIGVMASARSINDRRVQSRVTHEGGVRPYDARYGYNPPSTGETVVEERRYD